MENARRELAASLAELGYTVTYIMAAADALRGILLLLAAAGLINLAAALLPSLLAPWLGPALALIGAGMLAATAYSLYVARATSARVQLIRSGALTQGEKTRMLRLIAPDMALALATEAWLTLLGLTLIAAALLLYEAPIR